MSSNGKGTSFKVLIFSTSITVDRTEHRAQDVHNFLSLFITPIHGH